MNLNDLETPPPTVDPTVRTPQQMAAAKRQRAQTEPDTAPVVRRAIPPAIVGAVGVLAVAGVLALAISQHGALPAPRPISTPAPTFVPFSVAAQDGPGATEAPRPTEAPAVATIGAYAAPDGALLGPIEVTRTMSPVAHYGAAWVQANVEGSGLVWLRVSDVPQLGLVGQDLSVASPAAAEPQTGQGMTLVQPPPPAAEPAPAPVEQPIIDAPLPAETGAKAADDRAAHHAAAVARLQLPPPARDGEVAPASERGSK